MKKYVTQEFALLALFAALLSMGLTACKSADAHPAHSEQPSTSEHPR